MDYLGADHPCGFSTADLDRSGCGNQVAPGHAVTARVAGRKTPTRTPAPGRRLRSVPRWPGPGAASGRPGTGTGATPPAPGQAPTRARSRIAPGGASQDAAGSPTRLEHIFYYASGVAPGGR
jgi:hypothetical protein